MRKITYLLAVSMLTVLIAGCGKSDGTAADKVRQSCQQGRDLLIEATNYLAMNPLPVEGQADPAEKALQLLSKAEAAANDALAIDASKIAKAPAYELLGEIKLAVSQIEVTAARSKAIEMSQSLPALRSSTRRHKLLLGDMEFITELAKARDENAGADISELAAGLKERIRQRIEQVTGEIANIQQKIDSLAAKASQMQDKAEPIRSEAAALRRQMRRNVGDKALELDAKASELEAQYAKMQAQIAELTGEIDIQSQEISLAKTAIESMKHTLKSADNTIERLISRSSNISNEAAAVMKAIEAADSESKTMAAELSTKLDANAELYTKAIATADQANSKFSAATSAIREKASAASQMRSEAPDSAMADVLRDISSPKSSCYIKTRSAEALMLSAELRRELLELNAKISREVAMAGATATKLDQSDELAATAAENYQKAAETYESATSSADAKLKWQLQTSQARSLWGSYMLSKYTGKPDRQLLGQALEIVNSVLEDQPDKPEYFPAREVKKLITDQQSFMMGM